MSDPIQLEIASRAQQLVRLASRGNVTIGTAESCTAGMIGAAITTILGSSQAFRGGVIAYHNDVKASLLGVTQAMIDDHGAVSGPVAQAMALGALQALGTDFAVAVTGIAGPSGGSAHKPVGTVWIGTASTRDGGIAKSQLFQYGDIGRESVRAMTCKDALEMLVGELRA